MASPMRRQRPGTVVITMVVTAAGIVLTLAFLMLLGILK